MRTKLSAIVYLPIVLSLAAALFAGCATSQPTDWDSRVGHYTYADAFHELGPPNRQIQLANGATEFKWFLQSPPAGNALAGGMDSPGANNNGMNGANNSFGAAHGASPVLSDRYLQLTFDSKGVLTAWSKNY